MGLLEAQKIPKTKKVERRVLYSQLDVDNSCSWLGFWTKPYGLLRRSKNSMCQFLKSISIFTDACGLLALYWFDLERAHKGEWASLLLLSHSRSSVFVPSFPSLRRAPRAVARVAWSWRSCLKPRGKERSCRNRDQTAPCPVRELELGGLFHCHSTAKR